MNAKQQMPVTGQFRKLASTLDEKMESYLLSFRASDRRSTKDPLSLLTIACLPLAAILKYVTGPHNPFDIFVLVLVFSCIIFRHYGFFAVGVATGLDLIVKAMEVARLGKPELWPKFLLNTALSFVEWLVVCSFVIITLEKWATLRHIKRRTDDDLALAKSLQSSLARRVCELPRVSICGSIHQCDSVGGDFYYFRPFGKKMVTFCVGDVMGKGISASLLMAMVMSFVYEWGKQSCNPATIAGRLNRRLTRLWDGRKGWFITIFYGIFDEETGLLEYCAAGQQGGFLLRDGALSEFGLDCDPPLGVVETYDFTPRSLQLQPYDQLLLYTDGVYEAKSENGVLFGTERLGRLFAENAPNLSSRSLLKHIEDAVLAHTGGRYTDDTTLLTIRYMPIPTEAEGKTNSSAMA